MPDNLHAFSQVIQDERKNYQLTEADSHFLAIIEKHAAHLYEQDIDQFLLIEKRIQEYY